MNDSFYLKHDLDTREDELMRAVLMKLGARGYGLFWMVAEDLHHNNGRLKRDIEALSWSYRETVADIQWLIDKSGLFYEEDGKIASRRVDRERAERREAQRQASLAGKASAASRAAQRSLNARSTELQPGEERRGEEGEKITAAPSAADLEKLLSTTGDKLGITLADLEMRLPFKHGDNGKGTPIIELDVKTCESILETHKNLGFKLERALRSRINMKKIECAK